MSCQFCLTFQTKLVSKVFICWLNFLFYQLSEIDFWPSRQVVSETMPMHFRAQFPTTRVITDATKLPGHVGSQSPSFSSYKNTNTLKVLIGCTPRGLSVCLSVCLSLSLSLSLSPLRFNGHAKDDGSGGDNWSYKSCNTPVKSSPPTNQHPVFLQAGCPSCHPTNNFKALKGKYHIPWTCLSQAHLGVFQLCL